MELQVGMSEESRSADVREAPVVNVAGLRCGWSHGRLLLDLDELTLYRGEILGVLGPNGAGKSSLLRMLALLGADRQEPELLERDCQAPGLGSGTGAPGAVRSGGGAVEPEGDARPARPGAIGTWPSRLVRGEPMVAWRRFEILGRSLACGTVDGRTALGIRRRLALVMQSACLLDMPVRENVALGLRFRGVQARERERRIGEALELFGLGKLADRNGLALSGGEAQRVSLARALACEPELLLLDEPFSQLDQPSRASLVVLLADVLRSRGQSTIFVTHDRDEILALADRVLILSRGKRLQSGSVKEVFARPADPEAAAFVGVDSFFSGVVAGREGALAVVDAEGFEFRVVSEVPVGGPLRLAVHPGDVIIELGGPESGTVPPAVTAGCVSRTRGDTPAAVRSSARNRLACVIERLDVRGAVTNLTLAPVAGGGGRLRAAVTGRSVELMGLAPGQRVFALIKATAVHTFKP